MTDCNSSLKNQNIFVITASVIGHTQNYMKVTFLSIDASYLLHLLLVEIHTQLLRQGSTGLPSEVRRIKWSNEITWCRLLITGNGRGLFIIKYSDGRNAKGGY